MVPQGKIVTGFTNMYIADVPNTSSITLCLFFHLHKNNNLVFYSQQLGKITIEDTYLQNGGYYLGALSDYYRSWH